MNSVVITGAAGFIGYHLSKYYLDQGFNVFGMDNLLTGSEQNVQILQKEFSKQFYFINADVNDFNSFSFKPENLKYVFHLASAASVPHYQKYSLETMQTNSVGLQNALRFADQMKSRLIYSSTSEVYGDPKVNPQSESYFGNVNSFGPRSCYDESKRFGEALICNWNQRFNTAHGLVRIFNTYGPNMNLHDGRVVIQLLKQALNEQDLTVYGDGAQTRSFCYIDDLIRGLVLYADSKLSSPVNLGNNQELSVLSLAHFILKLTESKSKIQFQKLPAEDPVRRKPDLTLAKEKLGYNPTVSLEEGILKMAEWVKKAL